MPGRLLIRDNGKIFGMKFRNRVDGLGLEQICRAFRSRWQNGFAERRIGSIRRDGLEPVIAIHERPLRRVVQETVENAIANALLEGKVGRRDTIVLKPGGEIEILKAEAL